MYDLSVACSHPLPAPEISGVDPDVTARIAIGNDVPADAPPGTELAHVELPYAHYFVTQDGSEYWMRFPRHCDVAIRNAFSWIDVAVGSEELVHLGPVLVPGNILATMLTLQQHCVLHGSAVAGDRGAIGFIGPSGMGKSTLAAALCGAGMELVTDDVLVIDESGDGFSCRLGPNRVRLRPSARALLPELEGDSTEDGRASVALEPARKTPPLNALVLPQPRRDVTEMKIERLHPASALVELTRFPRTLGWSAPRVLESIFRWNALLARSLPIYSVTLPWGAPLSQETLDELRSL